MRKPLISLQDHIKFLLSHLEAMKKRPGMYLGSSSIKDFELWLQGYSDAADLYIMMPFIEGSRYSWETLKRGPVGLRHYDTLDDAIDNVIIYLIMNKNNNDLK